MGYREALVEVAAVRSFALAEAELATSMVRLSLSIDRERWQRLKAVVADALEQPAEERAAFAERACANDKDLLADARRILAQEAVAIDQCADDAARFARDGSTAPGRRLGAYEVVRELGRGGMGTVWLARRADKQFDRLVAIKLLKRGTDTEEVLRRFDAERQILAQLDHPNIARLLDAGTSSDGLPYFVMEHVAGARVTDYVFAQNLSIRDRLKVFLKICAAVEFAHRNLVIHRDLKPTNILVTAEGEPKLLDFGIAKLVAPGAEAWGMTSAGGQRLTPAYASPEQVRGEPVTTVSDVYALGVLLYELFAEVAAHQFTTAEPTSTELLRVVCEQEPKRPSSVARTIEVRRQLDGDLDNIVLRAIAKAPDRRYRGVSHLADDIKRHLQNRPVRARPDTLGYRTRKFLLRNKAGVAIASAVTAMLLTAGVLIAWEAQREHQRFEEVRRLAESFLFEFDDAKLPLFDNAPKSCFRVARARIEKTRADETTGPLLHGVGNVLVLVAVKRALQQNGFVHSGPIHVF